MVTKVVNIKVQESGIDSINSDLQKLEKNISNVDSESKKASTSLKDVGDNGGAIALLDELTGGLATKIRDAAEASKLFNVSLKGTRTALIATGIGAFVVALGLVVAYWDDIVAYINDANVSLEEQASLLESNAKVLDSQLLFLKQEAKFNEQRGISNEENLKKQKEILEARRLILQENIRVLELQLAEEESSAAQLSNWQKLQVALGLIPQSLKLVDPEEQQRINDLKIALNNLKTDLLENDIDIEDLGKDKTKGKDTLERQSILRPITPEDIAKRKEERITLFNELFNLEKEFQAKFNELGKEGIAQVETDESIKFAIRKENDDKYLRYKKLLSQQEIALTQQTLSNISQALGQTSTAGKAVAVAQALINTYQGITAELQTKTTTPFEFGLKIANIASVTAIGFKAVKDILSTKTPNIQGARGGGVSGGGSVPSAPAFNVVGNSGVSQIAQTLNQEQEPVEAYVVASNVTSAQEANRDIVDNASLG